LTDIDDADIELMTTGKTAGMKMSVVFEGAEENEVRDLLIVALGRAAVLLERLLKEKGIKHLILTGTDR